MSAWDLYVELMKVFEEHDEEIRKWMIDRDITVEEFKKKVNERNELTVLDVRNHLDEFHASVFGKKTN